MNRELTNIVIPVLPYRSIDEQLAFYKALGFAVMDWQTRPNPYASVRYAFTAFAKHADASSILC